ncbi:30S ribosomal protein S8 [Candidatus Uhrbacteria bacterium]|nr:30S ribosomal protein S8 [Candidatus Uhrbacteria bacterium]
MTDPIADMLTRIRNAARVKKPTVAVPYSRMKKSLADILLKEGYIDSVTLEGTAPFSSIVLSLKYDAERTAAIHALKRISKPGSRAYVKNDQIPRVLNNYGMMVLSTSKGLMTNRDARREKIGGEIVCEIN